LASKQLEEENRKIEPQINADHQGFVIIEEMQLPRDQRIGWRLRIPRIKKTSLMKSVTRKTLKWIGRVLGLLGVCLAGFTAWYYIRATSIVGEWSEPKVQILGSMQSVNADGSAALVDYFYDVSQIARRKYPSTVWKGTGWERRITERVNRVAYGNELAVVDMATGEIIHHIFSSRMRLSY